MFTGFEAKKEINVYSWKIFRSYVGNKQGLEDTVYSAKTPRLKKKKKKKKEKKRSIIIMTAGGEPPIPENVDCLVVFYTKSTLVGHLWPNPVI